MQEEVAPRLGLIVLPIGVTKPEDFAEAFATIIREQAEALYVLPTPVVSPIEPRLQSSPSSSACRP